MILLAHIVLYLMKYMYFISALPDSNEPFVSFMPNFEKQVIREHLSDSYWIDAFQPDSNTSVGFIVYGLVDGTLRFYPNPYNHTKDEIEPIRIEKFLTPVGMDQADISGDGFNDIIICFDYGNTIKDFNVNGGHIVWLENPGHHFSGKMWQSHYVGRSPTMHRLKVGHFTQNKRWEIIGLPIVNGPFDVPVPVLLFQEPANSLTAQTWHQEIIDQSYFHIIHDATKFSVGLLDHLLIASQEGLTWLFYHENLRQWMIENIAEGEQNQKKQTNFYGSGSVSIGKIGNDRFGYIAALEPFHGNVVSVYTKSTNNDSLTNIHWQRHVLDIYGHPDQNGEGTSHHIICADFDHDGDDEFLVALRGPYPYQGIYYYKLMDPVRPLFSKWKVSDDSASRIAIADYDYDNYLDFSSVGYSVPGYYLASKAPMNVFYNRFHHEKREHNPPFQVKKQNDELLFMIPRTSDAQQYYRMPFLSIADIDLSLEVLPPFSSRHIDRNTYVKVLAGRILWIDSSERSNRSINQSRTFLCHPKTVCSIAIRSDDNRIQTEDEGAVFIVMETSDGTNKTSQLDDIEKILLKNIFPTNYPDQVRHHQFQFLRADQHDWGKMKFKDVEFYNMRGFDIQFADNGEKLCHIQLWAAGTGTNAGVHNHLTDRFCEVHVSLVNGNRNSGMQYVEHSERFDDPFRIPDSEFIRLDMPSFHEHGPLWYMDSSQRPIVRNDGSVVYPWHKWQSGNDPSIREKSDRIYSLKTSFDHRKQNDMLKQSFDIWIAVEFNPRLSLLSKNHNQ